MIYKMKGDKYMKRPQTKQEPSALVFWLTIIGLLAFGLGLVLISQKTTNEFWKATWSNLASAIMVAGIFSAVNEKLMKDKLVELILSKIKLKDRIDKTGIEEVYTDIRDIDYRYYLKDAKNFIDIIHVYGRTWTTNNLDEIREKLFYSNCQIRIILVSPESIFIEGLANYYNISPEELKHRISEVTKMWTDLAEEKNRRKKSKTTSSLKLFYHKGQPASSLYRIDERIINVQNKFSGMRSKKLPTIVCRNTSQTDDLYENFLKEIEDLILTSDELTI